MALLPYFFDDIRPRRLRNQLLNLDLSPDDDFLTDDFDLPMIRMKDYVRPWRNLTAAAREVGSTIKNNKDKFQVNLDVQHFAPDEISVKTSDGYIVVEGRHEEKKDEHGFISRRFKRRYALPKDCNPETVESKLSSDGVLSVVAPRSSENKNEKAIPITHTGPIRKQHHEEVNRELEEETKSPQKKRKR